MSGCHGIGSQNGSNVDLSEGRGFGATEEPGLMGASESKGWDSWGDPTDVFACCGATEHHAPMIVPQPGAVDSVSTAQFGSANTGAGNSVMTGHTQQQVIQKAFVLLADYEHYPTEEHLLAFGVACCILSAQERMSLAKQLGGKHTKVLEGMRYARKVFQDMNSTEENKFRQRLSQVEFCNFQRGIDEVEHFEAEIVSGNFHGKARRMSHLQVARHDSASSLSSHGHSNTPTPTAAAGLPPDLKRRTSNMTSASGTQAQGPASSMAGAAGMARRGSVEGEGSLASMGRRSSEHGSGGGLGSSGHITREHSRGASRERSHSTERRPSVTSHDSHHHHHHHHHSKGESRDRSRSTERRPSVSSLDSHHTHHKHHSHDEAHGGHKPDVLSNKGVAVGFGRY